MGSPENSEENKIQDYFKERVCLHQIFHLTCASSCQMKIFRFCHQSPIKTQWILPSNLHLTKKLIEIITVLQNSSIYSEKVFSRMCADAFLEQAQFDFWEVCLCQ